MTYENASKVGLIIFKLHQKLIKTAWEEAVSTRKVKNNTSNEQQKNFKPALTPEARENQLISLAVDLTEKKLRDGTASNQLIVHYLKLGSTKERLEKELMEKQKELMDAKTQNLKSAKRIEELYADALDAMRNYRSGDDSDEFEDY